MLVMDVTMEVRGQMQIADDVTIHGRVDGPIRADGYAVVIGPSATIRGDILARDVTVFGSVSGTLLASEVVDIRPTAHVTGRVIALRFILTDGGSFQGTVQPQRLDAALRVARHRLAEESDTSHSEHELDEPRYGTRAATTGTCQTP
jgi:cytoskeletal protein CcmA (bactofilin family)